MKPLFPFLLLLTITTTITSNAFNFDELTVASIQTAFREGTLTSRQLLEHYLTQIQTLNPVLHAVIEVSSDALDEADRADRERLTGCHDSSSSLHGIPILLKDVIATDDCLNTTAGSLSLVGSVVPRDAGVVRRLRQAGAVILGKASMSEWLNFRTSNAPSGWSARGGQSLNPYVLSEYVCGSSAGSAIAVAANMVAVSLATETDGSISCPSASASVVGIKPTVGLTSRAGVVPISPRMDTIGPICRTVADAVEVLEAIAGFDKRDAEATGVASEYIPQGGYKQFLKEDGLKGKRVGVLRKRFFDFPEDSVKNTTFQKHFDTMRQQGAILIDNLEIANVSIILDSHKSGEQLAMLAEFKMSLNVYLSELLYSPVRSLQDIIDFNYKHRVEERIDELGQSTLLAAQNTHGLGPLEQSAIATMAQLSTEGLEKLMMEKKLDALVTPDATATSIFAIGGYPGISVPAGYEMRGKPFGIFFGGLRGSEPKLIEIAYAFEQATKVRKPPPFVYERSAQTRE